MVEGEAAEGRLPEDAREAASEDEAAEDLRCWEPNEEAAVFFVHLRPWPFWVANRATKDSGREPKSPSVPKSLPRRTSQVWGGTTKLPRTWSRRATELPT